MRPEDIQIAIEHGSESESVDYKLSFDPSSASEWLEIVKDVVALANSGGGAIIFGVADSGTLVGCDGQALGLIDPADLTNKIYKHTGQQFSAFSFQKIERQEKQLFVILVSAVSAPVVFAKPGTYDIGGGKQKTAFSGGTVYFRHGAKSEPGNSDDLRLCLERRIEEMRKSWFEGIVKVVEAPIGSTVHVVEPQPVGDAAPVRLVNDPSAPAYRQLPVDATHPYRQKEIVQEFNRLTEGKVINPYHIKCVRQAHGIDENPNYCYRMKHASAQFSKAFLDWIVEQHGLNSEFFELAKEQAEAVRRKLAAAANI